MSRGYSEPPRPELARDWLDWAKRLTAYLGPGTPLKARTEPETILLAHKIGGGNIGAERPVTDGILLYDPMIGAPVFSVGNVWMQTGNMHWRNTWVPGTYYPGDVALQYPYLVIANKQTSEIPATELEAAYPGADANIVDQPPVSEQVYWTGQEYFIQDVRYIDGFRFYTPLGDFEFSVIYRVRNADGTLQKVKQASAWQSYVNSGWKELTLPSFVVVEGERLEIWLGVRATVQPNVVSGPWTTTNRNGQVPAAGEAFFRNNAIEIQVNNIDGDAVNRAAELATIPVGASLDFGGLSWTVTSVSSDASTHTFFVEPGQGRPDEGTYTFEWEWGAPDPLPYVADPTFWQNNQNIRGSVGTEIVDDMTETDAQYGVDILSRQVIVSDDWDIMAISGGAGATAQVDTDARLARLEEALTDLGTPVAYYTNVDQTTLAAGVWTPVNEGDTIFRVNVPLDQNGVPDPPSGTYLVAFSWDFSNSLRNTIVEIGYSIDGGATYTPTAEIDRGSGQTFRRGTIVFPSAGNDGVNLIWGLRAATDEGVLDGGQIYYQRLTTQVGQNNTP